jgi:hypothetical protein
MWCFGLAPAQLLSAPVRRESPAFSIAATAASETTAVCPLFVG